MLHLREIEERYRDMEIEDCFKRLEEIATEMERNDIRLSKAMALYEEAMVILKVCNERLKATEQRIYILKEMDGKFDLESIDIE